MAVVLAAGAAVAIGAFTSSASTSRVRGGTPQEQALIAQMLQQVPASVGLTASLAAPPAAVLGQSATANTPDLPDNWLYLTTTASTEPDAVEAQWYASLVARAYANAAQAAGVTALAGASVTAASGSGKTIDQNAWLVPNYAAPTVSDASSLLARFEQGATQAGVTFVGAKFTHLLQMSPVITVRTSDPAAFVAHSNTLLTALIGGSTDGFDGYLIHVDDSSNNPVMVAAVTPGLHSGEIWARPGLDGPFHYGR